MRPAEAGRPRPAAIGPGLLAGTDRGLGLVVFDKDGTLIDFEAMWGGWALRLVATLEEATGRPLAAALGASLGFDPASGEAAAGGPLAASPMGLLRDQTIAAVAAAGIEMGRATTAVSAAWLPPDPVALASPLAELPSLFRELRGRRLRIGIATSDDREPARRTLEALGVGHLVDALVAADDGIPPKPAADPVLRLCREVGVPPARTVVVGDAPADLAMARAAGVGLIVGVLTGVGASEDLAPLADEVLDSVADLPALLDGLNSGPH